MERGGSTGRGTRALAWIGCLAILPVLALLPAAGATAGPSQPSFSPQSAFLSRALGRVPTSATRASACGGATGVVCSQVVVPLDRTGQVPGSISLHVEVVPAAGTPRGAVFLIAGGPGQGSAHVFGLDDPGQVALDRFLFPGYTLVAYDDRGTGDSGLIDCPATQVAITADQQRAAAAACAVSIGSNREFYSTAQHAEDLDAVRQALGFDKIALYGISYGTKLAMAYALAHPDHVERLLLASVLPPEGPDPYSANVLRDMPATLNSFCSDGSCKAATKNYAGDVVAVANALAAKPIQGKVVISGKTVVKKVDGLGFLSAVLDSDLNPGLAAELPATVHAARLGNTQALVRLVALRDKSSVTPSIDLSGGLYAATVCRDGPFPWSPDTPVSDRQKILTSAVATLPAGTFGPFGSWSYRFGNADFCVGWPSPSGGAALGTGPLPDVPVLAVNGGYDMRTPTDGAASVVSRFPHGQLLVVPGIGHDAVDADVSGCAVQAVRLWMTGGTPPTQCPRPKALVANVPALPSGTLPRTPHGAAATYSIASKTVDEAEADWLMTLFSGSSTIPGIFGGKATATLRSLTLAKYSIAPGVTLTGTLRRTGTGFPANFQGTLTVGGPVAAEGILGLNGTSLRGSLGGKIVGR